MKETKAMTIRMSPEEASELEAVAVAEGSPVSEVVRKAISIHIEAKRGDKEFQDRLRKSLERNQAILRKLAR